MKQYTETSSVYSGMAKTFFFIEGTADNTVNTFVRSSIETIGKFLRRRAIRVNGFNIVSLPALDKEVVRELILRQEPTITEETLERKIKEAEKNYRNNKSRLLFINDAGYDCDGIFKADIYCEDEFGTDEFEVTRSINSFLQKIALYHASKTPGQLYRTRYRFPDSDEEDSILQEQDNLECLCNDLIADSIYESHEVKISPILFDDEFNISLPLYPQISITLDPLPKALYILFLQHPEGIVLKDIYKYEDELKKIYSHVSGRKNPTVINRMFRALVNPTDNPLHKNLSIIRKCFTSKLNYNIARNYIPAHGRTKAHNIPLESEYVIMPEIA